AFPRPVGGSVGGRARLARLAPAIDRALVQEELAATSEALTVLIRLGRQPYHDLPDLSAVLPVARVSGLHLEPHALMDVASFIEGGGEIARNVAQAER